MSLINQMLQDLEKRRASGAERSALPDQVRVLPREEIRSMPWWLVGIAVAVALIALLAWQFNSRAPSPPAPITQAPNDQQPQVVPGSPASRLALELQKAPPLAAGTQPAPRKSAPPEILAPASKKTAPPPLATAALVVEPAATAKPASPAVKAEPAKSAAPPVEPPKSAAVAAPVPVLAMAAPAKPPLPATKPADVLPEPKVQTAPGIPQIDKRSQILTPQQLAENDYREAANFLNQGRLAEAQDGFRRALQHSPGHVGARQGLFGLLVDARKSGEAEQLLQEGLKLNPNQPGFAMALASLQFERGDAAAAIDTMLTSAPAAQSSPDYLARLAGLLQRQSRHREAIDNYQAALRLAPGSGVWLMGMGISLQAVNRNSEAQEAFRRARSSNTLNPELQAFVDQRLKQLQ